MRGRFWLASCHRRWDVRPSSRKDSSELEGKTAANWRKDSSELEGKTAANWRKDSSELFKPQSNLKKTEKLAFQTKKGFSCSIFRVYSSFLQITFGCCVQKTAVLCALDAS